MNEPWIDLRLIYLMFHILGTAVGAGAAFTGDVTFLRAVRNKILTKDEVRVMTTTSRMVWVGLFILLLSGIGLVLERPEIFLQSGKFWAKMTVIGVIVLNGLLFHFLHFSTMHKSTDKKFSSTLPLIQKRGWLVTSGALSVISWNFVIVLGVLGRTPFTYTQFLLTYLLFALIACGGGLLLKKRLISY